MDEHVLLLPIRFGRLTLRELLVSVDDPDGLVTALA
jgi:hypothetical protein